MLCALTAYEAAGLSATSEVAVTVNQTVASVTVTPGSATVLDGGTRQFTATAKDQFGKTLSTQPSFTWSVSGGGTVNSTGTVQAAAGGTTSTASVSFGSAPATLSNLTATVVSTQQVNLAWTDNANNAANVVVQRSLDGSNWTTLTTLAGTAASYSDTSVSKGATYSYRVYAVNSFGASGYSNVATVTTPNSNGGGSGGYYGSPTPAEPVNAGQVAAKPVDPPPLPSGNDLWQQVVARSWAEVMNYVNSLLSLIASLWGHGSSTLG